MTGGISDSSASCTICLVPLDNSKSSLDSCVHLFHFNCIHDWSLISNTCPLCKARFKSIKKLTDGQASPFQVKNVDQKYETEESQLLEFVGEDLSDDDDDEWTGDGCEICGSGDSPNVLMLCDLCDKCYHTYCLTPPLSAVPDGHWFCEICVQSQHDAERLASMPEESQLDTSDEEICNAVPVDGTSPDLGRTRRRRRIPVTRSMSARFSRPRNSRSTNSRPTEPAWLGRIPENDRPRTPPRRRRNVTRRSRISQRRNQPTSTPYTFSDEDDLQSEDFDGEWKCNDSSSSNSSSPATSTSTSTATRNTSSSSSSFRNRRNGANSNRQRGRRRGRLTRPSSFDTLLSRRADRQRDTSRYFSQLSDGFGSSATQSSDAGPSSISLPHSSSSSLHSSSSSSTFSTSRWHSQSTQSTQPSRRQDNATDENRLKQTTLPFNSHDSGSQLLDSRSEVKSRPLEPKESQPSSRLGRGHGLKEPFASKYFSFSDGIQGNQNGPSTPPRNRRTGVGVKRKRDILNEKEVLHGNNEDNEISPIINVKRKKRAKLVVSSSSSSEGGEEDGGNSGESDEELLMPDVDNSSNNSWQKPYSEDCGGLGDIPEIHQLLKVSEIRPSQEKENQEPSSRMFGGNIGSNDSEFPPKLLRSTSKIRQQNERSNWSHRRRPMNISNPPNGGRDKAGWAESKQNHKKISRTLSHTLKTTPSPSPSPFSSRSSSHLSSETTKGDVLDTNDSTLREQRASSSSTNSKFLAKFSCKTDIFSADMNSNLDPSCNSGASSPVVSNDEGDKVRIKKRKVVSLSKQLAELFPNFKTK